MRMRATWVFTVVSLTISSAAISAFDIPRATNLKTSSSRGVSSPSSFGGVRSMGAFWANSSIRRRVIDGAAVDRRPEQGLPLRHDLDPAHELIGGHVLQQEAARARAQCLVDVLVE